MKINKDTFCIAPYQSVWVNSQGKLRVCCKSHEKLNYDISQIKQWYHSDTLNSLRKNLNQGIKDSICQKCWVDESTGNISQRQIYNKHIAKIVNFDKKIQRDKKFKDVIENLDHKNIKSFDLALGNLCNLKCIMCNSNYSSQLLAEAKLHPELKPYSGDQSISNYQWPETKEFVQWCEEMFPGSIYIKFSGGEPFLNPYLLKTLKAIPDTQKKKCILQFITNLTKINKDMLEVFNSFKEVWLIVSVEGTEKTFEYIRYGHKWNLLKENIEKIHELKLPNIHLNLIYLVQSITLNGLCDLIDYCNVKKLKLSAQFLDQPVCFTLQGLKTEIKLEIIKQLEKRKNNLNQLFVKNVIKFIKQNLNYNSSIAKECVTRLKTFDRIRKNNFEEIIPIDFFI